MRKMCTIADCPNVYYSRGMCTTHYRDGGVSAGKLERQDANREFRAYRKAMDVWTAGQKKLAI